MRSALLLATVVAVFGVVSPPTSNADDKWEHVRERQKKWEEYQRENRKKAEEHARKLAEFERERYKKQREYDREWWQKQREFERETWQKQQEFERESWKKPRSMQESGASSRENTIVVGMAGTATMMRIRSALRYDEDAYERLRERDEAYFEWLEERRERYED